MTRSSVHVSEGNSASASVHSAVAPSNCRGSRSVRVSSHSDRQRSPYSSRSVTSKSSHVAPHSSKQPSIDWATFAHNVRQVSDEHEKASQNSTPVNYAGRTRAGAAKDERGPRRLSLRAKNVRGPTKKNRGGRSGKNVRGPVRLSRSDKNVRGPGGGRK